MGVFNEVIQAARVKVGLDDIGTDGKAYNREASTRLFDEIVVTSPYRYPEWNAYFIGSKAKGTSDRIWSGQFNEKMEKALADGADPTVGLKATAKSFQTPEVVQALLDRGADPASKKDIPLHTRIHPVNPKSTVSAIEQAGIIGNIEAVRVMWDHINKDPKKYPDFTFDTIFTMAGNGHRHELALYVVDRAKKELPASDYKKILDVAMKGAVENDKVYLIYELKDRGAVAPPGDNFMSQGMQLKHLRSPKEQAGLTRALLEDLDNKKNASPKELEKMLEQAISVGSPEATKAIIARGADPLWDNAYRVKTLLVGGLNPDADVLKELIEPVRQRGSDRDKMMIMSIYDQYQTDMRRVRPDPEHPISQQREQMMRYMESVTSELLNKDNKEYGFKPIAPPTNTGGGNSLGLSPEKIKELERKYNVTIISQAEPVSDVYTQLMERLKPAASAATAETNAPAIAFKPQPTLAVPQFA